MSELNVRVTGIEVCYKLINLINGADKKAETIIYVTFP